MQNWMTRRFTLREKILLLVLIVILLLGLYFFLVFYPVRNQLNDLDAEMQEVEDRRVIVEAREKIYDSMKEELEEIFSMPKDEITYMPEFDNMQELLVCFHKIFANNPNWDFDNSWRSENGIVTRQIDLIFEASDFENAKKILGELSNTGYRCLLDSLSVSPSSGSEVESGALNIRLTIYFYEIEK